MILLVNDCVRDGTEGYNADLTPLLLGGARMEPVGGAGGERADALGDRGEGGRALPGPLPLLHAARLVEVERPRHRHAAALGRLRRTLNNNNGRNGYFLHGQLPQTYREGARGL